MLPGLFSNFIALDCDRCQFIEQYLAAQGINTSVIQFASLRHIFVQFPSSAYSPLFRMKTVVAHYDRTPGCPGANDNSAAVFQLLDWAVRLSKTRGVHNVRILFTDGEESGVEPGVRNQGSFGIASGFKTLGLVNDDVYVLDCCGRGDMLVLSQGGMQNSGSRSFKTRFEDLQRRTGELLRTATPENWMILPTSYSDNAGFLACGIPAAAITVLPSQEATKYLLQLRQDKTLEAELLTRGGAGNPAIRERLPETWRLLHTPSDDESSLTPKTFTLMAKLLDLLGAKKTMA